MKLLTRTEFNNEVFKRDNYLCVICNSTAVDSHHILDRALWDNGGNYLSNGVSLCAKCHIKAETTDISCNKLREMVGINIPIYPDHFYINLEYDKWGNIIKNKNVRIKGELFSQENVQRAISSHLNKFSEYWKYPRTYHFEWSPGLNNDDRVLESTDGFNGKEVVVTEKLDGENTTIYNNYVHARSIDSKYHETRTWVQNFASTFNFELPSTWRICGENVFAIHSIKYTKLKSYFYAFSLWEDDCCMSWDDTVNTMNMFGIETCPVLYRGIWNEKLIQELDSKPSSVGLTSEGFVVRITDKFKYSDFRHVVGKCVRKNHVSTGEHWMNQEVKTNILKLED